MNSCISDRLMLQLYVYAFSVNQGFKYLYITGMDPGGSHPARTLPKIGKNMIFFGVKS